MKRIDDDTHIEYVASFLSVSQYERKLKQMATFSAVYGSFPLLSNFPCQQFDTRVTPSQTEENLIV